MNKELKNFYENSNEYFNTLSNQKIEDFKLFIDFVKYYIENKNKILDLGCGLGQTSNMLNSLGYNVLGYDCSERNIKYAESKYPNINFKIGNSESIEFNNEIFDAIVSYNSFEHFNNIEKSIDESLRVLKKGGYLLIHSPNLLSPKYPINSFLKYKGMTFEGKKNIFQLINIFFRNIYLLLKIKIKKYNNFIYRKPILDFKFPDNDATCYLNPIDIKKYLLKKGCIIINCQNINYIKDKSIFKNILSKIFPEYMGIIRIVAKK